MKPIKGAKLLSFQISWSFDQDGQGRKDTRTQGRSPKMNKNGQQLETRSKMVPGPS
jgi:hypothetical protein